jgi:hypothetical protein
VPFVSVPSSASMPPKPKSPGGTAGNSPQLSAVGPRQQIHKAPAGAKESLSRDSRSFSCGRFHLAQRDPGGVVRRHPNLGCAGGAERVAGTNLNRAPFTTDPSSLKLNCVIATKCCVENSKPHCPDILSRAAQRLYDKPCSFP